MTVLPNVDGGGTPQPSKRKRLSLKAPSKLSLKYHNKTSDPIASTSSSTTENMDSMTGITAFFPASHRIGPYAKYEPADTGRGSGTDDSPASENTSSSDKSCPPVIATLANLGNTCFLNSVLYTLRFTPQFLHQLHHMVMELGNIRPPSSEDLSRSQLTQMAVETLHDLYQALRGHEDNRDLSVVPLEPSVFHMALREVNPMFETHQQHDAHELLVCLLDNVRETCLSLAEARTQALQDQSEQTKSPATRSGASGFKSPWGRNGKKRKAKAKEEQQAAALEAVPNVPPVDPNFIARDFEGVMVLKTMCLECESSTERKETFSDICLPIPPSSAENGEVAEMNPNEVFKNALLSSDFVRGTSKYYCEECMHMNEARRCTRYETLPRILTLQLKRFTSTFGSMFSVSKVNDYMPTPLELSCFCETCCGEKTNEDEIQTNPAHSYKLFAVIMHLGITMASGHYVSYVRANDNIVDYCNCDKNNAYSSNNGSSSSSGGILKFLKSKTDKVSSLGANVCRSSDCCGIRLSIEQGNDFAVPETCWLECDDENVSVLTTSEFVDVLSRNHSKKSSLTPYLLFYVRSP